MLKPPLRPFPLCVAGGLTAREEYSCKSEVLNVVTVQEVVVTQDFNYLHFVHQRFCVKCLCVVLKPVPVVKQTPILDFFSLTSLCTGYF